MKTEKKRENSHFLLDLLESALGLVKETINDALAEIPVLLVIVHFEDLFECALVEDRAVVGKLGGALCMNLSAAFPWSIQARLTESAFLVSAGAMVFVCGGCGWWKFERVGAT